MLCCAAPCCAVPCCADLQVNNCYQSSDPVRYPLTDGDLKLGFDVLGCLQAANKLASERLNFCFEPFDWQ